MQELLRLRHTLSELRQNSASGRFRGYEEGARRQVQSEMEGLKQLADRQHHVKIAALEGKFANFADEMKSEHI